MIKSIEIENIRIFEDNGWKFNLKPLTIFAGTNSSGKSTLLKILPLLRQSMGIEESLENDAPKLKFTGSQIDLGNYKSFVSHNDTSKDITISVVTVDFVSAAQVRPLFLLRKFTLPNSEENKWIRYQLKTTYRFGIIDRPNKTNAEEGILPGTSKGYLKQAYCEFYVSNQLLLTWKVEFSEIDDKETYIYEIFIERDYFEGNKSDKSFEVDYIENSNFIKSRVLIKGLKPEFLMVKAKEDTGESRFAIESLPYIIYGAFDDLQDTLAAIDYIGPLRTPAKRFYITHDITPPMDPAGEFLPYVLKNVEKHQAIHVKPGLKETSVKEPLESALNTWLYYIRTGENKEVTDTQELSLETTKVLVEFKVKSVTGMESHALADSGFGYSQLLPILVRGLLAQPNSILVIEQPELHLNPAIQVRVAEFLVAMALSGKQVIIETHSEHIVNTIRVLTAEDITGNLATKSNIYYIEIDSISKKPVIHELTVKSDGTVPKWPKQFFGEASNLTGRLLRAQKRFKEEQRGE